jgi:HAL2 family 3'(2'),5'-bisphosphate nucleotidase
LKDIKGKLMLQKEKEIGLQAVSDAMALAGTIQREMTGRDTLTKTDRSPVTVADFAVQALICKTLSSQFPRLPIVGEEDSLAIRQAENLGLADKICSYLQRRDNTLSSIQICDYIDLGGGEPQETFWTLDPIDGTKGFLRGEHFAIALALIMDSRVRLGILGCPNLGAGGTLFWATENGGSWKMAATNGKTEPARVSSLSDSRQMKFVESYESSHSDKDTQLKIAQCLAIKSPPEQIDSQVKYGVVAAATADIYLRIPHPATPDYREKIWDHAAGSLIVEEAGGMVSDIEGKKLDFSVGKTLRKNRGILATNGKIHQRVLDIIAELDGRK